MVDGLRQHGLVGGRKIVLHEGKVLDGWQLYRACVESDIEPVFADADLPNGMSIEEYVSVVNDLRRHETQEVAMKRARERRERVLEAHRNGKSQRQIAQDEGVSAKTINNDLSASGVAGVTPEPGDTGVSGVKGLTPESGVTGVTPGKVTGRDGKKYQARKPRKLKKPAVEREAGADEHEDPITDAEGLQVPDAARPAFHAAKGIEALCREIDAIKKRVEEQKGAVGWECVMVDPVTQTLANARQMLHQSLPTHVCPYCKGSGQKKAEPCNVCKGRGWTIKATYNAAPPESKGGAA
jgi:hypothetical protein